MAHVVIPLLAVYLLAYRFPVVATGLLPLAIMAAPRIMLGEVLGDVSGETLFIRLDHILAAGALAGFLRRGGVKGHATHAWYALALACWGASATVGLMRGECAPAGATVFLAQTAYLGVVLVLAFTAAPRLGDAGLRVFFLSLCGFAVYGIAEMAWPMELGGGYRTYERVFFEGQANHAGGLLALGVVVGMSLGASPRWRVLAPVTALLCAAALAGTHSREAVVAAGAGLFALYALRRPRVALAMALTGALVFALAPSGVGDWLAPPGSSLAHRLQHWHNALWSVPGYAVLGLGPGARHRAYYDNQYVLLLAETGFLGLGAFLSWLWATLRTFGTASRDPLAAAALAGLVVLAVQGMAAVIFLVTLAAGPAFWLFGYAVAATSPRDKVCESDARMPVGSQPPATSWGNSATP